MTMKKVLNVSNMTCGHCKMTVEKALMAISGVHAAEVDLIEGTAEVEADENVDDTTLKMAVEKAGYPVTGIQ